MRLFTHRIKDLDFLKTISVVVNVGGGTTSILHNVSLAVCCNNCLMAKYRLENLQAF